MNTPAMNEMDLLDFAVIQYTAAMLAANWNGIRPNPEEVAKQGFIYASAFVKQRKEVRAMLKEAA